MRPLLRFAAATGAFALLHSLLATEGSKRIAGRMGGRRAHRLLFNAQSLLSFALLLREGARIPPEELYRLEGARVIPFRLMQGAGFLWAGWTGTTVGWLRLAGIEELPCRDPERRTSPSVAQGPERRADGTLPLGGPFRFSRHPMNASVVPILWGTPRLTSRRLAFNLIGTAYLVLGSLHEDRRLARAHGEEWERYRATGVPFFLPRPERCRRRREGEGGKKKDR